MQKILFAIAFVIFFRLTSFCQSDTIIAYNYFQKGYHEQAAKRYQEAIAWYDSAAVANPNYSKVYFYRALAKYHLNDLQGSIDDYSISIEKNNQLSSSYDNRGYSKFLLGNNEEALKDYNKSIELNPQNQRCYVNRGGLEYKLERYKDALSDFKIALTLKSSVELYYDIGSSELALKNYKNAVEAFDKYLVTHTDNSSAYLMRGLAKVNLNDKEGGCPDFQKALALGNKDAQEAINEFCK
ncbi:MAG: tetratricopeptide repeat protein [Bacteroidetes bacterium]|nr:tetratricopeptide repeat protein [Bacteroidota bacterium]